MNLEPYKNFLDTNKLSNLFDTFSKIFLKRKLDVMEATETEFLTSHSLRLIIKMIDEFKINHRVIYTSDISHTVEGIDVIYLCKIQHIPYNE